MCGGYVVAVLYRAVVDLRWRVQHRRPVVIEDGGMKRPLPRKQQIVALWSPRHAHPAMRVNRVSRAGARRWVESAGHRQHLEMNPAW